MTPEQEIAMLRTLLRDLEWSGYVHEEPCCPMCYGPHPEKAWLGPKERGGHMDGCRLAEAIK